VTHTKEHVDSAGEFAETKSTGAGATNLGSTGDWEINPNAIRVCIGEIDK
jgi:hypothetical protein